MLRVILYAIVTSFICAVSSASIASQDALQKILDSELIDLMGNHQTQYSNKVYRETLTEPWTSWCDPQLGCLQLTDDFVGKRGDQGNPRPWSRDQIMTKFSLHTRKVNSLKEPFDKWVYLSGNNTKSLTKSTFDASKPTKILVHGFQNNGCEQIFKDIVINLLKHGDYNVILSHWGPGAGTSLLFYAQAYSNTRVVGLEIAFLVNSILKTIGGLAEDYHIIGHSLGGHIAGYAGEKIEQLGRITGLDPAGPAFEGMGPKVCLDPTDAQFVDVLHTAAGGFIGTAGSLGTLQPMGHLDFYPNGGKLQPGCDVGLMKISCSHHRARELFRDSLVSSCSEVAYECRDYASFQQGKCKYCGSDLTHCALSGMSSNLYPSRNRNKVPLYYATSGTSPFCHYCYAVEMTVAAPKVSSFSPAIFGLLNVSLSGHDGTIPFVRVPDLNYEKTEKIGFILEKFQNIGKVTEITLLWTPTSCQNQDCNLYVQNVTLTLLNEYPIKNIASNEYFGCPRPGNDHVPVKPKTIFSYDMVNSFDSCK